MIFTAITHISQLPKTRKLGTIILDSAIPGAKKLGIFTKWDSSIAQSEPVLLAQPLNNTPITTTISGAGSSCIHFNPFKYFESQANCIKRPKTPINMAKGVRCSKAMLISENVVWPSCCKKPSSPKSSASQPTKWGTCFKININPMAASMPLITDAGIKSANLPTFNKPNINCNKPAITNAAAKACNAACETNASLPPDKSWSDASTNVINPAAGPLTET